MKTATLALAAALALGLSGCGGSDDKASTPQAPVATPLVTAQPTGAVVGQLLTAGGPSGTQNTPIAGKLVIKGDDGSVVRHDIGTDGHFAIQLSPGRYRLTATSTVYLKGKGICSPSEAVTTLVAGQTSNVDVYCQLR